MATVSITVPDALVPRVVAAMRASYPQYASLTDAAAFKAVTADYWRGVLIAYETGQAQAQAQATVAAQAQTSTSDASVIT